MENDKKPKKWSGIAIGALLLGVFSIIGLAGAVSNNEPAVYQPASVVESRSTTSSRPIESPYQAETRSLSNDNYYTNSRGNEVHSPAYSNYGVPAGASAQCNDGTYSFSQSARGTCSHHGGVDQWL